MKSAYCIAITACLTVIWLYEEKKKQGMAGNLCWICSFTGKKTDAFYLAGGIDSFRG